ncbi:MAG: TolC family protein [Gemmataceae bacterium]
MKRDRGCRSGRAWNRVIWFLAAVIAAPALAQDKLPPVTTLPTVEISASEAKVGNSLPINLATALKLAGARPVDIQIAAQRTQIAAAEVQRAQASWLPNLYFGVQYDRHDGQIQDVSGRVFTTSRSSTFMGAGPVLSLELTDALYGPLVARQRMQAARANEQTAANDSLLSVAESYFSVQQARGELTGASLTTNRMRELVRRAEKLAPGLIPPAEANRARAEMSRREQSLESARERWQTASAELTRLLRLDPLAVVEPAEPPQLMMTLFEPNRTPDELIPVALTTRPELAAEQALVQATLTRLKQEKIRPLVPSVVFRPASTSPSNFFAGGYFGGGINGDQRDFGGRTDFDLQLVWELKNLGAGNRALVNQRRAENEVALLELLRTQDRVASEVVRALAQARSAATRVELAEAGLREAVEAADRSLDGLGQTRRAGELIVLVVRPQEAVASVQSLAQAYGDYYGAVADSNRAQFRLYRALGQPAQCVMPVTLSDKVR